MRIFDLHNDVATQSPRKLTKVLRKCSPVLAVWTTRLKNPIKSIEQVRRLTRLWAIEDLGFCCDINRFSYRPLYASLTWNNENQYGAGVLSDEGLKPLGHSAIKRLEGLNVALDVAHLNQKSFYMAAESAKKPFICSHTCFNGVFCHKRNLDDNQIRLLIERGGIIGLSFVSDFMGTTKASVKHVIAQIEYFCGKFKLQNLSIGSDFYGTDSPAIKNYNGLRNLKNQLLKLNYTQTQIDGIFFKNAHEFFLKTGALHESLEEQNGQQYL